MLRKVISWIELYPISLVLSISVYPAVIKFIIKAELLMIHEAGLEYPHNRKVNMTKETSNIFSGLFLVNLDACWPRAGVWALTLAFDNRLVTPSTFLHRQLVLLEFKAMLPTRRRDIC